MQDMLMSYESAAGAMVDGDGLQLPDTGTPVRVQRGVRHVLPPPGR